MFLFNICVYVSVAFLNFEGFGLLELEVDRSLPFHAKVSDVYIFIFILFEVLTEQNQDYSSMTCVSGVLSRGLKIQNVYFNAEKCSNV
jgi:hypothetical protein